ncbi:GNAT family N-acetyltransferase [Microbacterium sp. P05]|uniref:GNAT family N-acetyltransferase n=1 Tax=Microbacterium sp. P05 TaxID=3366948 RepID=UPI003747446C
MELIGVEVDDSRAQSLRDALDAELAERYGVRRSAESPEVTAAREEALRVHPADIVATLVAVADDGAPLGQVMLRRLGEEWELKRLIVRAEARGRGIGRALVAAVIDRARTGGAHRVILQTGDPQHESLALYRAMGFTPIPVYEPYVATMPHSRCFELTL